MNETVPADIAATIKAFEQAVHSDAYCPGGSVDETRAALDATILHHLRGYAEMKAGLERIEQGV